MNVTELTDKHIEQLAATWAIRLNKPNLYYTRFLKEVKSGERAVDLLPYFIIKYLLELGYSVQVNEA